MEKVLKFLKDSQTYYLATADENGQPHVRPFGSAAIFEGKLYFCTNNCKPVYQQIKKNPKIEISAMVGNKWIRICAEAYEDDRVEARIAMMETHPELRNMYKVDDGKMVVMALANTTAQICSFTDAPETITF